MINKYPSLHTFSAEQQEIISGNLKGIATLELINNFQVQLSATYLAPDVIPQGTIDSRFSLDIGLKKAVQKGKGEFIFNVTDLLNTMEIKREIFGEDFSYTSNDFYETQVARLGYSYKF